MSEAEKQTGELATPEALARLSAVSLIELIGVSVTILVIWVGPRLFGATEKAGWQRDCLWIAIVFGIVSLGTLFVTLICSLLFRWSARIPEKIIWLIFGVNTVAFSLGMARTGGPSRSFLGQLVPMQLSGILLLEQQKAIMTTKTTRQSSPWYFAGFAIFAWITVVLFRDQVARLFGWESMIMEANIENYGEYAATVVFVLGMAVTVVAYWLPRRPGFIDFFRRTD